MVIQPPSPGENEVQSGGDLQYCRPPSLATKPYDENCRSGDPATQPGQGEGIRPAAGSLGNSRKDTSRVGALDEIRTVQTNPGKYKSQERQNGENPVKGPQRKRRKKLKKSGFRLDHQNGPLLRSPRSFSRSLPVKSFSLI